MPFSTQLNTTAKKIYNLLDHYGSPVPIKDYGWENYLWTSERFRWAHLQKFYSDKISILHCVVMPHNTNAPIYGFDVNELSGQLIGMFLDLTPVDDRSFFIPRCGEPRPIPEWGDFFSPMFVCCKPDDKDIDVGVEILQTYLYSELPGKADGSCYLEAQQRYVTGQKKNPMTWRMLEKFVGKETTSEYIETLLFPDIIDADLKL